MRLPPIDNERDAGSEILAYVLGSGRRKAVRGVGARRRQWKIALPDHLLDNGVAWPTHANGMPAGRDDIRDRLRARQHQRQWTWPKRAAQFFGHSRPVGYTRFR